MIDTDPRCERCGNKRSEHNYRHMFVGPSTQDTINGLVEVVNKWQPIETAPTFKPILLWDDYYLMRIGIDDSGEGVFFTDTPYLEDGFPVKLAPTHWMPLPVPPT